MDVNGYWNMPDKNKKWDLWKGQIILSDDGWFEGVVNDLNSSSYKGDRFVFGIYEDGKYVELYKLSPKFVSLPLMFHGENYKDGYYGLFDRVETTHSDVMGYTRIDFKDLGEVEDSDRVNLINRIEDYKIENIINGSDNFYEIINNSKVQLKQVLDNQYKDNSYTIDKLEGIADLYFEYANKPKACTDYDSVTDIYSNLKVLVKEMSNNGDFSSDED
jgi:hypothetical protein